MSLGRRSVMIPLASAAGKHGRIAHVHADGGRPSNEAKLIPEIALLNDCKLYQAGTIALAALRQVALRPSRLAVTQWLGQPPPAYLSVSNAPDLYGMATENSKSAQLGLALALAMYQCQSTARLVIATGELQTDATLGHANGGSLTNVPVGPVGLIEAKLESVGRLLDDHKGGAFSAAIPFFFPKCTSKGEETLAMHGAEFDRIVAAYRERGIQLKLHPVSCLQDALHVLGLNRVPPTIRDRLTLAAAASVLVAGMAAAAVHWWLARPIALEFATYELSTGEAVQTPFPARPLKDGSFEEIESCFNAGGVPIYPAERGIVLHVVIKDPVSWTEILGGYHFAVVTVSELSGAKVFPPETWNAGPSDREVSIGLPIDDVAETNALMVLAKRFTPFDTEALQSRLAALVAQKPPPERINTAVNALAKTAPGFVLYSFQSVKGDLPCQQ
jgi:hypothetical protein